MKISIHGVDDALRHVKERSGVEEKVKELLRRVETMGVDMASVRFENAQYDGEPEVEVWAEWTRETTLRIHADGFDVGFIEFGTGVHYKEAHPEAAAWGAKRGSYGHGLGKLDSWRYRGSPGTNGEIIQDGPHAGMIKTHGNPPARAMYDTGKELRGRILDIAREVFG